jgi:hypothetical protein
MAPFLPLIPETRNLRRFLVSGINGKNGAMGFFSDQKSSPTRGWAFVPTGLYFLLPVMRINLQVLAGSGGMICSLVDPCLFGDTGIEPAELRGF